MKLEKFFTGLIAWVLSLAAALAGIGCIATGFSLEVDWLPIVLLCGLFALLASIACSFRWGSFAIWGLAAVTLALSHAVTIPSVAMLIYRLADLFDSVYDWGTIRISFLPVPESASPEPALLVLAWLVIFCISWCICRRRWVGFGLLAGLLPLAVCCILTDTIPAVWCISLLLGALLVLSLTQFIRRYDPASGNKLTALLLIPVLLISLLLPPYISGIDRREPAQQLQDQLVELLETLKVTFESIAPGVLPGNDPTEPNGIPTTLTLDLRSVGPLNSRPNAYLFVSIRSTSTRAYPDGPLYLRGSSYSAYTGTSWEANIDTVGENGWPTDDLEHVGQITIATRYGKTIARYFPYYTLDNGWTENLIDGSLTDQWALDRYTFSMYTSSGGASFTDLRFEERAAYLELPLQTRIDALQILNSVLVDPAATDTEKAALIAAYVRNSATYDLRPKSMPAGEDDFAIWFLQEGETGYCIHFATAATVLLRAAGVPARYVNGYLTQVIDDEATVTSDQAHAWVEYLDPQQGWTMLEVTPSAPDDPEPTAPPTTEPTQGPSDAPTDPTEPTVTDPSGATQEPTLPPTVTGAPTLPTNTPQSDPAEPKTNLIWLWYVLAVLGLWLILAGRHWLHRSLRRKWLAKGTTNRQAVKRWHYVRKAVKRLKLPMPDHLQLLAEKAVFSQHTLTEDEVETFDRWLLQAKRQLLTKPWYIRLALWFFYAL